MGNLMQDVRYGVRTLIARPGFTAVAVAVLALGIGANTAIFSLVNAFLLKPLVIQHPEELVGCFSRDTRKPDTYRAFSYPNYVDLRDKNAVFSSLMAHTMSMAGIAEGDTTRRVFTAVVSSNYFSTFGVPLYRGRTFTPAEEQPDTNPMVTIVSYSYWKKNGSDPDLIGKTVRVNSRLFTVVGIAAKGFTGTMALVGAELYIPLGAFQLVSNDFDGPVRSLAARSQNSLMLVGRLRPGVTSREADTQLAVVASQLEKAYPGENKDQTVIVHPLSRMSLSTAPSRDDGLGVPAALLLSMAGVVLLIASLNLANMMLARGTARRKEIAIRLAIGGSRGRIVRQLFTEGLILAALGGIAGLMVAWWSANLLIGSLTRISPFEIVFSATPDIRVLAVTMGFCLLSTVMFSLGPAWKLSRPDLVSDLKKASGDEAVGGARRIFSRRNLLVMGQLSLSLMMLAAAGLFVRSAVQATNIAPGFAIDNGLIAEVDASLAGYDETRGRQVYSAILTRLRRVPGVESTALAISAPFGMTSFGKGMKPADDTTGRHVSASSNVVTEDYFKTLNIPMLRGRTFNEAEMSPVAHTHVAVIDKLAAERLWPGGDALGKHVKFDAAEASKPAEEVEIVGIVGNVQGHIVGHDTEPNVYVPLGQQYQADMMIHAKLAPGDRAAQARLIDAVRREIRAADEHLPVLSLRTMRDHLDSSFDLWIIRTGATMLAIFGSVAMLLAVIGLYGVKAYTVAQRTREIGLRMALGATSTDTLRLILSEGLTVTLIGIGVGMVLAIVVGRVLAGMLFEVHAIDPVVFSVAPFGLAAVSMFACYLPARRAARVDPMVALRYE